MCCYVLLIGASSVCLQWHLADVSVAKGSSAAPCKFPCKAYLNQYNTSTTLYQQGACKYDVTLVTSDKPGGWLCSLRALHSASRRGVLSATWHFCRSAHQYTAVLKRSSVHIHHAFMSWHH